MSYANQGKVLPCVSESAFTEAYVVCVLGTGVDAVKFPAATTDDPFGVIQDTAASGDSVPVMVDGVSKVVANGAFSKGDNLAIAATTGRVDTVSGLDSSFNYGEALLRKTIGVALEAATESGQLVAMLIRPFYFPWA
jgi:hypothetical protein